MADYAIVGAEITYLPLQAPNGVSGIIDLESGTLVVGGNVVCCEPGLSGNLEIVGAGRIGRLVRRIVHAAPLRKLAGRFGQLAAQLGRIVPAPYGTALQAAGRASSIVSRIGRGDQNARASVQALASVALDATNPNNQRARRALNTINDLAAGRVPAEASAAFQIATTARDVASRLASGDPSARSTVASIVSRAATDPRSARALMSIRTAYRDLSRTSGASSDLVEGARLLWGRIRPHVGVRPADEVQGARKLYTDGVSLALSMRQ